MQHVCLVAFQEKKIQANSGYISQRNQKEVLHVQLAEPCTKVPAVITDFYIEQRDLYLAKKGTKNMAAASALHNAILDDDDSFPLSHDSKRSRQSSEGDPTQPSIKQANWQRVLAG